MINRQFGVRALPQAGPEKLWKTSFFSSENALLKELIKASYAENTMEFAFSTKIM